MAVKVIIFMLIINSVHSKQDIYDLLSSVGCSNFANVLKLTGYDGILSNDHKGPYTVFAPVDGAFDKLPPEIKSIFNYGNWELMFDIISYHITKDVYLIASLDNNGLYNTMLQHSQLRFNKYPPQIKTISGANITSADNTATNGVVHVIDRVLYRLPQVMTPQYVDENQNLSKMALLIDKGGLHDQLKDFGTCSILRTFAEDRTYCQNLTFFAPSDSAFDAAPKDFLNGLLVNDTAIANFMQRLMVNSVYFSSDLVSGQDLFTPSGNRLQINVSAGNITVNGSGVIKQDLITMNGVVHIIDKII